MRKILHLGLERYPYFPNDEIIHQPILFTKPLAIAKKTLQSLKKCTAVILTSKEAVKHFLIPYGNCLNKEIKIISIGDKTTQQIIKAGYLVHYQAKDPTQEGIIDLLIKENLQIHFFLLIKSNLSRNKLDLFFTKNNLRFFPLISYETELNKKFEKIELSLIDAIFFTSPSCVKFFFEFYAEVPEHIQFIIMGPITMEALKKVNKKYLMNVEVILG